MKLLSKNLVLLLSALLVLSTIVLGERGTASQSNERGLSVGRPTSTPRAPTSAPATTHPPTTGDDDDDAGKGKGGGGDDDDDDAGKGKGGGGDDDDDSGKGKGKGMDDYDDDYHSDYSFSYDGKGDGKGGGKGGGKGKGGKSSSSKSEKSSNSDESGKNSKESKKDGKKTEKPAGPPTPDGPTRAPSAPTPFEPTTSAPTSENSIAIRVVPYVLTYSPDTTVPSTEDFVQLAQVTNEYLDEFMVAEFAQTSLTNLDNFATLLTRNEFEAGEPVLAQWRSTGLFNPSSIFLPTVRELNQLVEDAFSGDNLDEYITRVRDLPGSNPFSETESVTFEQLVSRPITRTNSGSSNEYVTAGIAAGAAGLVVLAAGLAIMRGRTAGSSDANEEEVENIAPHKHKDEAEDANTVAGETVSMSLDGTSVAQSWRTPTGFKKYDTDVDEDEFEDEPLDDSSDDDEPQR